MSIKKYKGKKSIKNPLENQNKTLIYKAKIYI